MRFQASLEVIEKDKGSLWWAGKELMPEKTLEDYIGKNEKTKIVVKLTKVSVSTAHAQRWVTKYSAKTHKYTQNRQVQKFTSKFFTFQKGSQAPGREQQMTEDQKKQMMAWQYRKQEEMKVISRHTYDYAYYLDISSSPVKY